MKPEIVSGPRRNSFHGIEAASQSFVAGDSVVLASGSVAICADDAVAILGIAQADATGTTGADCVVTPLFPGDKVALDTWDTTPTAAIADAATFEVGASYELELDTAEWYADLVGVTNTAFIFEETQGSLADVLAGNTVYRGLFRIKTGVCQLTE